MDWPPRQTYNLVTRRGRNLALLARLAAGAAILIGFMLLLASRGEPARWSKMRAFGDGLIAPIWTTLHQPVVWAGEAVAWTDDYFDAIARNRLLEARIATTNRLVEERNQLRHENRRLRQLLNTPIISQGRIGVFAISGSSAGGMMRSAIISGGSAQGIRIGQPVRTPQGLIGRTIEVGANAARILLLTDAASRVPVRIERTGQPAMAVGQGAPRLEIRYVGPGNGPLRVGDRLVSSGDGGIYPPGVPVAVVTSVHDETATARPSAHVHAAGFVIVETPWLPPSMVTSAAPAPAVTGAPAAAAPTTAARATTATTPAPALPPATMSQP